MSEDNKPKVTLIKQPKSAQPIVKEPQPVVQPEKKVVVVRKKIVTVKPKVKVEEKKEEEKILPPLNDNKVIKPAENKPHKVIKSNLPRPSVWKHDNNVPEANRNLIGGERLSSALHNGPIVIKPNNLPPVPGQANQNPEQSSRWPWWKI